MTTSHPTPSSSAKTAPALSGIHHIGLTVRDVEASSNWYQRVLRLRRWFQEAHHHSDQGGFTVVLTRPTCPSAWDSTTILGIRRCLRLHADRPRPPLFPGGGGGGPPRAWAAHLDAVDVPHSGVYAMEGFPISLVTFLDPDGIQLELAIHS